jgi:putative transcriptional regulator
MKKKKMVEKSLGARMIEGMQEAVAIMRGEADPSTYRVHIPAEIDTRAIRDKLKLTQKQFALRYHIPLATLRDWEQGRRLPDAPARALIKAIREEPAAVRRALARSAA